MRATLFGFTVAASMAVTISAAADTYRIASQVWGHYQEYLRRTGNGLKPGGFAITKDGQAAFYVWCEDVRCIAGPGYGQEARTNCERQYETECVVFAIRNDIRVDYEVVSSGQVSAAPVELEPAPVNRIAVSPALQAEIDAYLRNASRAGRVWALAIAKDGSAVESASCHILGNYAGGGPCNHVQGHMQDQANREAVKRCGGADECLLLYAGAKKTPNIEIVVR